jgi:RNA methyltransferase, TrmH family
MIVENYFIIIMQDITSFQNPRFKNVLALMERRDRKKEKKFLIEGFRELTRAYIGGAKFLELWICPELFLGENEQDLIEKIASSGAIVFKVPKALFEKLSYRDRPDGLLAVSPFFHKTLDDIEKIILSKKDSLILIAEGIEKPGNLGSILRSSDAVKVDAVISCDPRTDIFNPNVIRSSVGTLFTQPVAEAGSLETLSFLKKHGFKLMAATPSGDKVYTDCDLIGKIALIVGCEQLGLTPLWMNECDIKVRIPMLGVADSLNVSTATTLLLYEYRRQNPV